MDELDCIGILDRHRAAQRNGTVHEFMMTLDPYQKSLLDYAMERYGRVAFTELRNAPVTEGSSAPYMYNIYGHLPFYWNVSTYQYYW